MTETKLPGDSSMRDDVRENPTPVGQTFLSVMLRFAPLFVKQNYLTYRNGVSDKSRGAGWRGRRSNV